MPDSERTYLEGIIEGLKELIEMHMENEEKDRAEVKEELKAMSSRLETVESKIATGEAILMTLKIIAGAITILVIANLGDLTTSLEMLGGWLK